MKGKEKTLYYAVSRRGQGNIYVEMPERDEKWGLWKGHLEGCYISVVCDMEANGLIKLPPITFDDDPVELKLSITYG